MMNVNDKNDYHKIIREMIKNENELRSSRNNWYMAIQSFLFSGVCVICAEDSFSSIKEQSDIKLCLLVAAVLIGLITSISFLFVAWRSEKAISMAMNIWNLFLEENSKVIKDYPPICLITDSIVSEKIPTIDKIGIKDWVESINKQMYPKGKECKKCIDGFINKFEWLMPFKLMPFVFTIAWSIICICLCK